MKLARSNYTLVVISNQGQDFVAEQFSDSPFNSEVTEISLRAICIYSSFTCSLVDMAEVALWIDIEEYGFDWGICSSTAFVVVVVVCMIML